MSDQQRPWVVDLFHDFFYDRYFARRVLQGVTLTVGSAAIQVLSIPTAELETMTWRQIGVRAGVSVLIGVVSALKTGDKNDPQT